MKQWTKKHRVLVIVIAIVIIAGVGMAILLPRMGESTQNPSAAAKQNTMKLEKMDLTSSISATGTIESAKTKTVSADVNGIEVKSVMVEEGDEVKEGQTLVPYERKTYGNRLTENCKTILYRKTK